MSFQCSCSKNNNAKALILPYSIFKELFIKYLHTYRVSSSCSEPTMRPKLPCLTGSNFVRRIKGSSQTEKRNKVDRQDLHYVASAEFLCLEKYQEAPLDGCFLRKMTVKEPFSMARKAVIFTIQYAILLKSIAHKNRLVMGYYEENQFILIYLINWK